MVTFLNYYGICFNKVFFIVFMTVEEEVAAGRFGDELAHEPWAGFPLGIL